MSNQLGTFVERCARGELLLEEIDDFVDEWHDEDYEEELHEYLGMTLEEYSLWVADPDVLPFIVTAHIEQKSVADVLYELERLPLAARSDQPDKAMRLMKWLRKKGKLD